MTLLGVLPLEIRSPPPPHPSHPPPYPSPPIQVRKAEFLLSDAVERDSDCIVTFGGVQSNHARTMAMAAREIGLDSILFILTPTPPPVCYDNNDDDLIMMSYVIIRATLWSKLVAVVT